VSADSINCAFKSLKSVYNKGTSRTVFAAGTTERYCLENFVFPSVFLKGSIHLELEMLTSFI